MHELPKGSRDARGSHIANVLALQADEEIRAVFATRDYSEGKYLVLATRNGLVKKTEFSAYDTVLREAGLIAVRLEGDDELIGVQLTDGNEDLLMVSARGQAARFGEDQARPMGRDTRGVKGINLDKGDRVLALCVARDDEDLLVVTGNGFGKRTPMGEYPRKGRPTKGVRTIKVSDAKGELVAARRVREGRQLLMVSSQGLVIRIDIGSIRQIGRSTQGVRLMDIGEDDRVCGLAEVTEAAEELDAVSGDASEGAPVDDSARVVPADE